MSRFSRAIPHRLLPSAAGAAALAVVASAAAVATPGVTPAHYSDALDPGASVTITKTVETPPVPPRPDIVLMADTTGSMAASIANVRSNAGAILSQIQAAQPAAQFAVAEYKDDEPSSPFAYRVDQQLTGTPADVVSGIGAWSASGGGDEPEAWIGALGRVPSTIAFRPGSTRVVVMFGDAPSHDPSLGFTESAATAGLVAAGAQVIAISVPGPAGPRLDLTGQASRITAATGGTLAAADPTQVAGAILSELQNLPATVTHDTSCDPGVSLSFDQPSLTVTSGDTATFQETVTVAGDAPQGGTVTCTTRFLVNGELPGPEFVQTVDIAVHDVTAPTVGCPEGPNPGGHVPGSHNQDGFFRLTVSDLVDAAPAIYLRDTGSGTVFGPYADGQQVKYTENGAKPSAKPMPGGLWHITGTGDAEVYATDFSGNQSAPTACLVPPPPS